MSGGRTLVVGGGLAGSEAAWQLARLGHEVELVEMRPDVSTPAHQTGDLAEIVCSNSFKSEALDTAHGLLKAELRKLGCRLLDVADACRVAAGSALAVDRSLFSGEVSRRLRAEALVSVRREEMSRLPDGPAIIATGPLTSDALARDIGERLGTSGLAFFDAIAPIFSAESIDGTIAWTASRYDKGEADYLNCPLTPEEYERFVDALLAADIHAGHDWEGVPYFEGCLPVEVMAARGRDTLRHGPMRPVGLVDPRTGRRPHAVVQLRREDRAGRMWNLVGFQTRLRRGDQERVLRLIPGLERAEFLRYGSVHRNTYLCFPRLLLPHGGVPGTPELIFAGQLTGVEGYTESIASGLLAALNLDRVLRALDPVVPPPTTMLGGLYRYLREADPDSFQPMNANFGLVDPPAVKVRGRKASREALAARALADLDVWLREDLATMEAGRDVVAPSGSSR